jgi:hypothetical protein
VPREILAKMLRGLHRFHNVMAGLLQQVQLLSPMLGQFALLDFADEGHDRAVQALDLGVVDLVEIQGDQAAGSLDGLGECLPGVDDRAPEPDPEGNQP